MKTLIALALGLAVSTAQASESMTAKYKEIASLSWLMPYCPSGASPWSPNGELIALYADGGRLGVFDVTHPENPPKVVLEMPSPTNMVVAWSPDGNWIACHTETHFNRPGDIRDSLFAIPVNGGSIVRFGGEAWPFFWTSDGALYGWVGKNPRRYRIPGARLRPIFSPTVTYRVIDANVFVTPGDPPRERDFPVSFGRFFEGDPLPGNHFLVNRWGAASPRCVVVDTLGGVLAVLDGEAKEDSSGTTLTYFSGTSVTSDGQWVTGFYEVDRDENIAKAPVYLVRVADRLRIPIDGAPYSTRPECSPKGSHLALDRLSGGVSIGVVELFPHPPR